MKKKIMLIIVCILILVLLITRDINRRHEDDVSQASPESKEETDKPKEYSLSNVWIIKNEGNQIIIYSDGKQQTYTSEYPLTENVKDVIGDLTIKEDKVIKISVKPDKISGKVLSVTDQFIEIEEYGKLSLTDGFQIYKIYGELDMGNRTGILIGYSVADFVVSEGKICAALLKEEIKPKNIRVLLKNNDNGTIFHDTVKITSKNDYTIYYGKKRNEYKAGKTVTVKITNKLLKEGRLRIKSKKKDGKIVITSLHRSNGVPEYRGTIEIAKSENQLTIINELSLEEYLYNVIPSEMPVSYGLEALKVQAVCARSYAYTQLAGNAYSQYGAHVDDSTSYQVYNNTQEQKIAVRAVNETYGQVIQYEDKIIPAYYFSTSCGHTASACDVWISSQTIPYLTGRLQNIEGEVKSEEKSLDMTEEKIFRTFIKEKDDKIETYDSEFAWYRWNTAISAKDLKRVIDRNLSSRYKANKELILTKKDGEYISTPIDTVGKIKNISITRRGTGGIAMEMVITGSLDTVKIISEYNIRTMLMPLYDKVIRQDKSVVEGMSLLPSAFFVMDLSKKKGTLQTISLSGGGYGHGVGMSQNGAKAMSDGGSKYDEILKHYYQGIEIGYLYHLEEEKN